MGDVVHDRSGSGPGSEVAPGSLLVAAPGLLDPNFRRTVIYMIEHRDRGSLGVVLNRPSEVTVRDVLPSWAPLTSQPSAVFVGGPVEGETALCLAAVRTGHDPATVAGLVAVRGPVALVDLDSDPSLIAPRLRGLRVFAGYSGWDAGQLAGEIDRGDWIVVPALPDDVLTGQDVGLWGHVLRRQGMPLALLATYPMDVRQN
ncbi:YqgE/AlgH family protein [Pseudonocardia nigra]|uniref:YqgE/AlgH family protein n=1 Tax=Pseudonocardia nigra TaxID=1921578 RepID=UPI001C5DEC8D|nr:YqgE/AlgH family protein [Pseudonocardia nigra]